MSEEKRRKPKPIVVDGWNKATDRLGMTLWMMDYQKANVKARAEIRLDMDPDRGFLYGYIFTSAREGAARLGKGRGRHPGPIEQARIEVREIVSKALADFVGKEF